MKARALSQNRLHVLRSVCCVAGLLVACGAPTATPTPATPEATVEAAPAPAPRTIDTRIWHVMYEGIHSLTVFPEPGPIRAYNPEIVVAPFGQRNARFSIFSRYTERETYFGPEIEAATSIEDLLERFSRMAGVEIVEDVNPAYQDR